MWPDRSGLIVPGDAKSLTATDLNGDVWPDFVVGVNDDRVRGGLRARRLADESRNRRPSGRSVGESHCRGIARHCLPRRRQNADGGDPRGRRLPVSVVGYPCFRSWIRSSGRQGGSPLARRSGDGDLEPSGAACSHPSIRLTSSAPRFESFNRSVRASRTSTCDRTGYVLDGAPRCRVGLRKKSQLQNLHLSGNSCEAVKSSSLKRPRGTILPRA